MIITAASLTRKKKESIIKVFRMKDSFWIAVIALVFILSCIAAWAVMDEGWFLTAVTLLLWDVLFLLVDRLLGMPMRKR